MKTKNSVLMLDPRGLITLGGNDVYIRQAIYEAHLSILTKSNPLNLLVLTTNSKVNLDLQPNSIRFINFISTPTFNSINFAFKTVKFIKINSLALKLIIVGDPWESYWSAYFVRKLLSQKTPIQIQLHGDIADPLWRKINLRNRIRYYLARFSVPYADSIRVVNKYQAELVTKHFQINRGCIEVIPVPINNLDTISKSVHKNLRTIGFFGRIHKDRGIWEFIELIRKLDTQTQNFKIIIAGDGPDKEKFLIRLYQILPKSRVSYLGHIPAKELRKVWRRVRVLVSLAPVESYGRVMREALVAGVPVWASSSSGVKDLMNKCEKGSVKIIDLKKSASELSEDFEVLLKTKVGPKFAKAFIKENETYAKKLAKSWINIINKSK
jgi:glycosyltransferase involved in cell wall biosynthesis